MGAAPVDELVGLFEAAHELGVFLAAGVDGFGELAFDEGFEDVELLIEGDGRVGELLGGGAGLVAAQAEAGGGGLEVGGVGGGEVEAGEVGGGHEVEGIDGVLGQAEEGEGSHVFQPRGAADIELGGEGELLFGGFGVRGQVGGGGEPEVEAGGDGHELGAELGAGGVLAVLGLLADAGGDGIVAVGVGFGQREPGLFGEEGADAALDGGDALPAGLGVVEVETEVRDPLQTVLGFLIH